jgi:hypothetical protein
VQVVRRHDTSVSEEESSHAHVFRRRDRGELERNARLVAGVAHDERMDLVDAGSAGQLDRREHEILRDVRIEDRRSVGRVLISVGSEPVAHLLAGAALEHGDVEGADGFVQQDLRPLAYVDGSAIEETATAFRWHGRGALSTEPPRVSERRNGAVQQVQEQELRADADLGHRRQRKHPGKTRRFSLILDLDVGLDSRAVHREQDVLARLIYRHRDRAGVAESAAARQGVTSAKHRAQRARRKEQCRGK